MFKKASIGFLTVLAALVTTACASGSDKAKSQLTYVGGHDPARLLRVEPKPEAQAPYALTGNTATNTARFEEIRVGSRIVGYRQVSN